MINDIILIVITILVIPGSLLFYFWIIQKSKEKLRQLNRKIEDTKTASKLAFADLEEVREKLSETNASIKAKTEYQDEFFAQREKDKQQELERLFAQHQQEYINEIINLADEAELKKQEIREGIEHEKEKLLKYQNYYCSILEPVRALEREKDEMLYQTIQISEENKQDIAYLLNEVLPALRHPDILCKLIWSEFIQKPMNEMLARNAIEEVCGIYKITNIENKKCYIGKSLNVKKRLQDHVKGALGIRTISDQKIHHEMAREGIWNFRFELLCECEKEELSEKEKYYISYFDSQKYGYNVASGG